MPEYQLKEGFVRNPLKRFRNLPCPCDSGQKVKRCHGLLDALNAEQAKIAREYLRAMSAAGVISVRPSQILEPK
jgi:uncharacterized protein YchJ